MKLPTSSLKQDGRSIAGRGKLVAELLAGSWRLSVPRLSASAGEAGEIAELLIRSGAGGLAWYRVRETVLKEAPFAQQLRQAYRLQALQSALHHRNLKRVLPILRSTGIEPVLVKGFAIARHYPELGMRPYSDLDLCVLPQQYTGAKKILEGTDFQSCDVDLHLGFGKFSDGDTSGIFERSRLVKLDDLEVRVPSPEDHFRFLCMHLVRHGAVRPLWLCDIAVLLETRSDDFDWDRCLAGSRRHAQWIACVIGLAHKLLGANIERTPITERAKNLPRWMVPAVLKEWGIPYLFPGQVGVYLRNPIRMWRGLLSELPRHWPNPIEATASIGGPFNDAPRFPFQLGHVVSRTAALLVELTGSRGPTGDYGEEKLTRS